MPLPSYPWAPTPLQSQLVSLHSWWERGGFVSEDTQGTFWEKEPGREARKVPENSSRMFYDMQRVPTGWLDVGQVIFSDAFQFGAEQSGARREKKESGRPCEAGNTEQRPEGCLDRCRLPLGSPGSNINMQPHSPALTTVGETCPQPPEREREIEGGRAGL
ncbi:hypothetical protein Q8A67_018279 [Cirrhinus molitorella]|uniref:Uncharacterized protein n=1 Tax=Cirrhinus molitorella TaxID=172907 RepID=A0AA88P8V5_9TELE|nr:hypothetical protein Q8A67_018279 [Cirrhinus molitorella]